MISAYLRTRAGLLAVSAGAVLWGTAGVVVHVVHSRTGLAAASIGCYRLAVAAAALALLLGRRGGAAARQATRRHPGRLVLAGAGLASYQALYLASVQYAGVSVSTLVSLGTAPIVLTATQAVRNHRWPSVSAITVLTCALVGLTLVSLAGGSSIVGSHQLLGVLLAVGSGLGYAGTTLVNQRLAADTSPFVLTALTCGVGAALLVPVAMVAGLGFRADLVSVAWLGYLGVVTTAVAYLLFFTGLRHIAVESAAVLTLLEPLAATALAAVTLGERLSLPGMLGTVLLLAAIAALYLRRPQLMEDMPAAG